MAGLTAAQAQEQLDIWLAASTAVAAGQEYSYSSGTTQRSLKKSDAEEIRNNVIFWNDMVINLSQGSNTVMRQGVPSGR